MIFPDAQEGPHRCVIRSKKKPKAKPATKLVWKCTKCLALQYYGHGDVFLYLGTRGPKCRSCGEHAMEVGKVDASVEAPVAPGPVELVWKT